MQTRLLPSEPITITPAAVSKSWQLIQEADTHLKLRVSILGGGCQGFRYDFSFSDTTDSTDTIITKTIIPTSATETPASVDWVIDAISLQFLRGVEIDYAADLQGERFIIRNLQAKTTCGCGSSFVPPDSS